VRLVFDGDPPGRAAAERSVEIFLEQDVDVRIVLLPGDQDPDEILQSEGREAFLARLDQATDVFDLKMQMIKERHDTTRVKGREDAIEEVLETLSKTNPLRQDMLMTGEVVKRLCRDMQVTESSLRARLGAMVNRRRPGAPAVSAEKPKLRAALAEREMLGALLSEPALAEEFAALAPRIVFEDESLARVAEAAQDAIASGGAFDFNRVCDRLGDDALTQVVVDLYHESAGRGNEKERFAAALKSLRLTDRKREMQELRQEIAAARASGDEQKELELLKRHQDLMK
jgi:DNA primase